MNEIYKYVTHKNVIKTPDYVLCHANLYATELNRNRNVHIDTLVFHINIEYFHTDK